MNYNFFKRTKTKKWKKKNIKWKQHHNPSKKILKNKVSLIIK